MIEIPAPDFDLEKTLDSGQVFHWEKVGDAPLPEARRISAERLMSGSEDSQRVAVSGIVRTAAARPTTMSMPVTSAPVRASGIAVVPSPQPRSRARSGGVIAID